MGDKAEREIPKAGTALGPGGVEARDAKRRDEANEVNNIRRGGKLNRLLNRAIRNNDIGGAAEIKKLRDSFGYKDSAGAGGNIPDVDVMRNQARIDSDNKAEKRFKLGQAQAAEDVATQAQNAARKTDKTPPPGGVEPIGGVVPETQGQPSDGAAQPTNGNPLIPDNESDFERQDREARDRVFGEKKSAPNYALDARKAFAEDLDKSELIKQTDEAGVSAREKAYKRAKSLGISREKLQEQQGWQTDTEAAEETRKGLAILEAEKKAEIKASSDRNKDLGIEISEDVYKQAESFGMSRLEFDKKRREKFDANKGARAKTKETADEALEIVSRLQIREDDLERISPNKPQGLDDSLIPTRQKQYSPQTETTRANLVESNSTGDANAFFDSLEDKPLEPGSWRSTSESRDVSEAMAPTIGGSLTESIGGDDSVWDKKEADLRKASAIEARSKFLESFRETRTLNSSSRVGPKSKEVTTSSYSKVRRQALEGLKPGTSNTDRGRKARSRKAQDELISKSIKSYHNLKNDKELMALPGFVSRYAKAIRKSRDQASQSLVKEIEAASKPAQQQ